jgi:hypothetical protein
MTRIGLLACVCLCLSSLVYAGDASSFEVKGSADVGDGKKGKASVVVTAKPGWHINEKAPLSLVVTPSPGVVVRKKKLGRSDLAVDTREQARFDIPVSCQSVSSAKTSPGARNLIVEANFVICKAELCTPQTEQLTIAVNTAADGAGAPGLARSDR